jgi:dihydropyrimidinase
MMDGVVRDYTALAARGALIDHAFHMIVSDTGNGNLERDIPALIAQGHRSIKVFTTYDKVRQDDKSILDLLILARDAGGVVCFHAENDGLIRHATAALVAAGQTGARYHAQSHPRAAEVEAIERMCHFAEYTGARIVIFHVSTTQGADIVQAAQARGVQVLAETCPHYLFMTEDVYARDDPARFVCSPPPRAVADQAALWDALAEGTIGMVTSDHAPYRMDASGKFAHGVDAPFTKIANGMPGLETRLPLMFDAMVSRGRMGLMAFAQVTATAPAQAFGLVGKGAIALGYDADLAMWDPMLRHTYGANDLHDNAGYNPYQGISVTGLPVTVLSRGDVIVADRCVVAKPGRGRWLPMAAPG